MNRVKLTPGDQTRFLEQVKQKLHPVTWDDIAQICGVTRRSIWDWRNEQSRMTHEALLTLHQKSGVPLPQILELVPDNVARKESATKAALAKLKLYGPPGTPEGRSKGGKTTQQRRIESPELYSEVGARTIITEPIFSPQLAELVGILLGDGQITDYQVRVTLNKTESEYGHYIANLMWQLFEIKPSIKVSFLRNTTLLTLSSMNVVDFLRKIELKPGNKISQQVSVPSWILQNKEYMRACVRGLMDTDGTVCVQPKTFNNHVRHYLLLSFCSHSRPLRENMVDMLAILGFRPKLPKGVHVALRYQEEVHRYFTEIGTSNSHHLERYQQFCKLS